MTEGNDHYTRTTRRALVASLKDLLIDIEAEAPDVSGLTETARQIADELAKAFEGGS